MAKSARERSDVRVQCKACPWRKSVIASRDIPGGYDATKHCNLKSTIAEPGMLNFGTLRVMACHESEPGVEFACVGWLANQLGIGNNIALRFRYMLGDFPKFRTVGPQHDKLEDTVT